MDNNILFKSHQHKITLFFKVFKSSIIFWLILSIFAYLFWFWVTWIILSFVFVIILSYIYHYFFYSKSYFYITNDKMSLHIRNWFFSQYNMSIYFDQIKDMAYSKNHFLHYFFNYWVLFARSNAWWEWSFTIKDIPDIEEIYKKVSYLYTLTNEQRKNLTQINYSKTPENKLTKDEIIKKVYKTLTDIIWIKEAYLLDNADKKFIFENEEDRNHWVYECIKRQITFVVTHDSEFRQADAPIVLKLWNKVIFPAVSFHEIQEKNTVSSSPWLEVHNYLIQRFKNVWEYDATLLIGFDI